MSSREARLGYITDARIRIYMYKKKFRQWKFQTNRKGWGIRSGQRSQSASSHHALDKKDPATIFLVLDLPGSLRDQEKSLHHMCEDIHRTLRPLLPAHHVRILSLDSPITERLKFPTPPIILTYYESLLSGMELASSGKMSTCGAFFERSFSAIEDVLKEDYWLKTSWILDSFQAAAYLGTPEILTMLLTQIYQMCLRLYGRDHPIAQCASIILRAPINRRSDVICLFATAFADVVDDILGRYDFTSAYYRMKLLQIKSHNRNIDPAALIPEWEKNLRECKLSPQPDSLLHYNAINQYADNLIEVLKDYERAEETLLLMPERLAQARKEDNLSMPITWCL